MPNLPISQLPELTAVTSNAEFAVAQGGITYKVKNSVINPPTTSFGLYSQIVNSTVISGTTDETSIIGPGLGTLSVSANTFTQGDSFRCILGGMISVGNPTPTLRLRVKGGPTLNVDLADSEAQPVLSGLDDDVFSIEINFTIRETGSAGTADIVTIGNMSFFKKSGASATPAYGFSFNTVNSTTFDTTVDNTLDITLEWSSDNVDNIIYSDIMNLRKVF